MQSDVTSSPSSVRYEGGANVLPLAGNDAGEILLSDHQVIRSLLDELCTVQESQQRLATLERLKAALTIHNATEENLVYPALETVAGKHHESQKLYKETAAADVLVFKLDTMLKTGEEGGFGKTAESLRAALLEHIEDEEQRAIPELRKHASPEQSRLLTSAVRELRETLSMRAPG